MSHRWRLQACHRPSTLAEPATPSKLPQDEARIECLQPPHSQDGCRHGQLFCASAFYVAPHAPSPDRADVVGVCVCLKATQYGQCVAAQYQDVSKQACDKEFKAFKDCMTKAVRRPLAIHPSAFSSSRSLVLPELTPICCAAAAADGPKESVVASPQSENPLGSITRSHLSSTHHLRSKAEAEAVADSPHLVVRSLSSRAFLFSRNTVGSPWRL